MAQLHWREATHLTVVPFGTGCATKEREHHKRTKSNLFRLDKQQTRNGGFGRRDVGRSSHTVVKEKLLDNEWVNVYIENRFSTNMEFSL